MRGIAIEWGEWGGTTVFFQGTTLFPLENDGCSEMPDIGIKIWNQIDKLNWI